MNGSRQPQALNCSGERVRGHDDEDEVREDDAGRQAHGHDAAEQASPVLRRVLHRHQHGAAPFTAERKALDEAARRQQCRCPGADLGVGGEQSDAERRQAHQHQRPHEHELAPEPIPEVAHHDAAERTRDEPDGEGREGGERACQLRYLREELRTEDDGSRRPVNEEVVPLDGGADGARDGDTPGL